MAAAHSAAQRTGYPHPPPNPFNNDPLRLPSIKDLHFPYHRPRQESVQSADSPQSYEQNPPTPSRHAQSWNRQPPQHAHPPPPAPTSHAHQSHPQHQQHQQHHTPPQEYPLRHENNGYATPGIPLSAQTTPIPGSVNSGPAEYHSQSSNARARNNRTPVIVSPRDTRPSSASYQYASYPTNMPPPSPYHQSTPVSAVPPTQLNHPTHTPSPQEIQHPYASYPSYIPPPRQPQPPPSSHQPSHQPSHQHSAPPPSHSHSHSQQAHAHSQPPSHPHSQPPPHPHSQPPPHLHSQPPHPHSQPPHSHSQQPLPHSQPQPQQVLYSSPAPTTPVEWEQPQPPPPSQHAHPPSHYVHQSIPPPPAPPTTVHPSSTHIHPPAPPPQYSHHHHHLPSHHPTPPTPTATSQHSNPPPSHQSDVQKAHYQNHTPASPQPAQQPPQSVHPHTSYQPMQLASQPPPPQPPQPPQYQKTSINPTELDTRGPAYVTAPLPQLARTQQAAPPVSAPAPATPLPPTPTPQSPITDLVELCSHLYDFANRYAQLNGALPHVTPSHHEVAEMSVKAQEVVRLLEDMRARVEGGEGGQVRGHRVVKSDGSGSMSVDDHRPPKRPWEDMGDPEEQGEAEAQGQVNVVTVGQVGSSNNEFSEPFNDSNGVVGGEEQPQTTAEQDMELIRTKRATTTAGASVNATQVKSKYRKRSRATPPGKCHSCNIRETPEWRRGPDGARTLCNACGLHYAKLMRKNNKMNGGPNGEAPPPIDMDMLRASTRAAEAEKRANSASSDHSSATHHQGTFQVVNVTMPPVSPTVKTDSPTTTSTIMTGPAMPPPPPWGRTEYTATSAGARV